MNNRDRHSLSIEVANEFIRRARPSASTTHMQVQKLVYFAHGLSLATLHEPLIEEQFEAWRFGPVERSLYDALKRYGSGPIARQIRYADGTPFEDDEFGPPAEFAVARLNADQERIVNRVYQKFGEMPAFRLSALTHSAGSPWANVYREGSGQNHPIPNEAMQTYFAELRIA